MVTGANGFLGRAVVATFLDRGHLVRALVRPSARIEELSWPNSVEVFRADLRVHSNLAAAFEGVDALVHLAACLRGNDALHFTSTIVGTERLLEAMSRTATKRLVLASSVAVYGWEEARDTLDEANPLANDLYARGAYTIAKTWQERLARRMSEAHGWALTILRPGAIWGPGQEIPPMVGPAYGRVQLVIGIGRRLPLSYVENCADCFVKATEDSRAVGETFNVWDGDDVTAWRCAGVWLRHCPSRCVRVLVPYGLGMFGARLATACSRLLFKGRGKLPALLMPSRFVAYRPLRFSNHKLREKLQWHPPWNLQQALERTLQQNPH